ncbi:thioesterase family protein [Pelosinus sp. sgz500959]|uniref:thioesterase family protein n=1 Tax=Pelosinus sp. sgz500959 TaxID=3242472 RepID=UPI00366BC7ED
MLDLTSMVPGLSTVVQRKITETDTAKNYGGGALGNLLATPAYVDLMIAAAVTTVDEKLPDGFITVGRSMSFTHEASTTLGMTVSVKATLTHVDGNKLSFDILAFDEVGEIGRGTHERIIVNAEQLIIKTSKRVEMIEQQYLK